MASIKQRLLDKARAEKRDFETLLVRFALERLLFRLSRSPYRENYVLKGGMLVAHWLDHDNRETRDADFLGFGDADAPALRATFAEIMAIPADDGLVFDIHHLTAAKIRDNFEYGGIRLRTTVRLERTRIPIVLDIGFGDALADVSDHFEYPSLLGMERPDIRAYPPASVIAEKFQAVVALGLANGRMKDFYDLWAIPQAMTIDDQALDAAIAATFARRATAIPEHCPPGLSRTMANDPEAGRRWRAYVASLGLPLPDFAAIMDNIWAFLAPCCARLIRRANDEGR